LLKWLREAEPGLELAVASRGDLAEITGTAGWEPRRYVPLITRFHAEGGSRCLIGTRALLGEGWDAPAVNVVIDLTAATTPTSVVQARGRALRLDAGWPGKVADNWGVVCQVRGSPVGGGEVGHVDGHVPDRDDGPLYCGHVRGSLREVAELGGMRDEHPPPWLVARTSQPYPPPPLRTRRTE
jgi:hypothetical protein